MTKPWVRALLDRFLLRVDSERTTVRVPRLVVHRYRLLLAGSLTLNVLVGWAWITAVDQARFQRPILGHAGQMAETAREMAQVYHRQIETLTRAYAHYGEAAITKGQDQARAYAAYRRAIGDFNQRAEHLAALGRRIRNRSAGLAQLLGEKE